MLFIYNYTDTHRRSETTSLLILSWEERSLILRNQNLFSLETTQEYFNVLNNISQVSLFFLDTLPSRLFIFLGGYIFKILFIFLTFSVQAYLPLISNTLIPF